VAFTDDELITLEKALDAVEAHAPADSPPAGTLVFVRDPRLLRFARANADGTAILAVGARPGGAVRRLALGAGGALRLSPTRVVALFGLLCAGARGWGSPVIASQAVAFGGGMPEAAPP
jgi:hypothetical protein